MKQKILFRVHAVQRMFERGISAKSARNSVECGEKIEDYSSEMHEPGSLILGYQGRRPIHIVMSENLELHETTVITVYVPDRDRWSKDFRTRRA
jgi:hypothetical protein